ncbi:MAG: DUF1634 domain-containing protein [Dehalococcoidia bacterium]
MMHLGSGESKLETVISYLLIAGIASSLLLIVTGLAFFYISSGNLNISLSNSSLYIHGQNFFSFIYELLSNRYTQDRAAYFISLGIVMLLLTAYVRVIVSVLYFAWKKDLKYSILTALVLIAITLSLALH